ncbi:hypothetical protein BDR04DRAFT_458835 [Suillus decipiens]|nr:hypothetical protein BDR04DRAFT_458835 [Suillus decipiens]
MSTSFTQGKNKSSFLIDFPLHRFQPEVFLLTSIIPGLLILTRILPLTVPSVYEDASVNEGKIFIEIYAIMVCFICSGLSSTFTAKSSHTVNSIQPFHGSVTERSHHRKIIPLCMESGKIQRCSNSIIHYNVVKIRGWTIQAQNREEIIDTAPSKTTHSFLLQHHCPCKRATLFMTLMQITLNHD